MRTNPAQLSFSAGELSPLLYGRPDYQRVQNGLRACRGFVPLRQGAVTRAPGTFYRGRTRGDAAGRLIAFEFAEDDAVVLEFTALKMRVWRYGLPVMAGETPYELTTPYDLAALARLKWAQSADVIYLVDGQSPPQRLARLALDNWTIGDAVFDRGPFGVENLDEAVTIAASAETGTITLTGVGSPFTAAHVGSLFALRIINDPDTPRWEGNRSVEVGDRYQYDGRWYRVDSTASGNTEVNPPVHERGSVRAGKNGPLWRMLHDDTGIVRVTAYANANSVTAVVIKRVPAPLIANPTHRWTEGAWSAKNGWPSAIAIHDQRLILAATPTDPRTLWFSAVGGFSDFEPGTDADASFAYAIAGSSSVNKVLWLQPGARGLHIGALGEEYSSKSSAALEAIGPQNAVFQLDSTIGSQPSQPIAPDGKPIFISRDGQRVFELRYAFDQDATAPTELSLPSEHLGAAGFEEIAWQSAPLRLAWLRRGSGDLAVLIHDPNEDVLGWAPYTLAGGFVESVAVAGDRVTLIVRRTIDGETVRHVEEVAGFYGVLTGAQPVAEAMHLFAAAVKTEAEPFTAVTGLDHLEGETVEIWTDKGALSSAVVEDGAVALEYPVTRATVGLFDAGHMIETMDIAGQVREGAAVGRQKRVKAMGMIFHRTAAAEMRVVERTFGRPDVAGQWQDVTHLPVPADLVDGWNGAVNAPLPSGWSTEVGYQVRPRGGAPMTLLAAMPVIDVAGG